MAETKYSRDHEWVRIEGDLAVMGISTYAQKQLGDVVFVDLPAVNTNLDAGGEAAVVESVKAASEVYAPAAGEVVEINESLQDQPGLINEDAEGAGWFLKLRLSDVAELDGLMSATDYEKYVAELD
ncbi:MAG: glycine cleavage system protein GcvH [Proteobacteria bacterium]|nr:glycine cleavage system protein GcvH [Pseudomonadota bacterium]